MKSPDEYVASISAIALFFIFSMGNQVHEDLQI